MVEQVIVSIRRYCDFADEWVEADRTRRTKKFAMLVGAERLLPVPLRHAERKVITLYEWKESNRNVEVSLSALHELGRMLDVPDVRRFAQSLIEVDPNAVTKSLPRGDASRGEIEVTEWASFDLMSPPDEPDRYRPANRYTSVYVDRVRFRMRAEDGSVKISNGQYARIDIPGRELRGEGAIVLAVNRENGHVLLVTQYRHPQRRHLTEAIRGFGMLGADRSEYDTALRELVEEGGLRPSANEERSLICLRSLFTDTGKLCERPSYFLAMVDRSEQDQKLNRQEPLMEDPIWVPLKAFYQSLRNEEGVKLKHGEFHFAFDKDKRTVFGNKTDSQGRFHLLIEDAFTTLAGLLAEPHLQRRFPEYF